MFSSLSLFDKVGCPRQHDCRLPHCFFAHPPATQLSTRPGDAKPSGKHDPRGVGDDVTPPSPKRRRLVSPQGDHGPVPAVAAKPAEHRPRSLPQPPRRPADRPGPHDEAALPRRHAVTPNARPATKPASETRTVSQPPLRGTTARTPGVAEKPSKVKVESLTPRTVRKAPALLKTRILVLEKLHQQMQLQNQRLESKGEACKPFVVGRNDLITLALDEEEEAATRLGDDIYKNAMAQKIQRVKKMTSEEWMEKFAGRAKATSEPQPVADQEPHNDLHSRLAFAGGLPPADEQIAVLRHLRTPLEGLEKFGYVTSKPSDREIASAKAGLTAAAGFESCERCGTRFQVFPGRDQHGRLTSQGRCRYHWARPNRAAGAKSTRILGQSESSYPCCNRQEGSDGCSEAETHVFATKDAKRLATILQFEHTPSTSRPGVRPVSFDCEMGYTTLGTEVIRVTAVSWPAGDALLDVLVRPYGEVLDLNTRFSGVTHDQFARALPYPADAGTTGAPLTPTAAGSLHKVASTAAARELLFGLLGPDTPLIGHAIDNDLNVCRIIHPFVIDTVLLYHHPRGLPIRYSLRFLSQKYLSRGIQTDSEAGHDSKEDAIATADLVTNRLVEKWAVMRHEGWRFVGGCLKAPERVHTQPRAGADARA